MACTYYVCVHCVVEVEEEGRREREGCGGWREGISPSHSNGTTNQDQRRPPTLNPLVSYFDPLFFLRHNITPIFFLMLRCVRGLILLTIDRVH